MNYEQANTIKHLAQPCNKVLEGLDVECPEPLCEKGKFLALNALAPTKCPTCNGTNKVKWKWEVKVGEWCLLDNTLALVIGFLDDSRLELRSKSHKSVYIRREHSLLIPIPHWEEIKEVLEKAGYRVDVGEVSPVNRCKYECIIIGSSSKKLADVYAETRQKAVMLATIELGREIKNELENSKKN